MSDYTAKLDDAISQLEKLRGLIIRDLIVAFCIGLIVGGAAVWFAT